MELETNSTNHKRNFLPSTASFSYLVNTGKNDYIEMWNMFLEYRTNQRWSSRGTERVTRGTIRPQYVENIATKTSNWSAWWISFQRKALNSLNSRGTNGVLNDIFPLRLKWKPLLRRHVMISVKTFSQEIKTMNSSDIKSIFSKGQISVPWELSYRIVFGTETFKNYNQ